METAINFLAKNIVDKAVFDGQQSDFSMQNVSHSHPEDEDENEDDDSTDDNPPVDPEVTQAPVVTRPSPIPKKN